MERAVAVRPAGFCHPGDVPKRYSRCARFLQNAGAVEPRSCLHRRHFVGPFFHEPPLKKDGDALGINYSEDAIAPTSGTRVFLWDGTRGPRNDRDPAFWVALTDRQTSAIRANLDVVMRGGATHGLLTTTQMHE